MTTTTPLARAVATLAREHGSARIMHTAERRAMAPAIGVPQGRALVELGGGRIASVTAEGVTVIHKAPRP